MAAGKCASANDESKGRKMREIPSAAEQASEKIVQWRADKYPPFNQCIYCGEADQARLTDEHIIPLALLPKGGDWFLPKASCRACADITKRFEGQVCGGMFGPLREQLSLKTRNRGAAQKKTGRVSVRIRSRDGGILDQDVLIKSFPKMCIGFSWPVPGIVMNEAPRNDFRGNMVVRGDQEAMKAFVGDGEAFRIGRVGPLHFARMIAKIAYCYAVARYGAESFQPVIVPLILGQIDCAQLFVGGDASAEPPDQNQVLHDIFRLDCQKDTGPGNFGVAIRLFAMMGMPRYHAILGTRLKEAPEDQRLRTIIKKL
jgi:hypothetical protein